MTVFFIISAPLIVGGALLFHNSKIKTSAGRETRHLRKTTDIKISALAKTKERSKDGKIKNKCYGKDYGVRVRRSSAGVAIKIDKEVGIDVERSNAGVTIKIMV